MGGWGVGRVDSERDAPGTVCGETPQPLGCGNWDSGFIGGWGLVVVTAIVAGVAGGAGGFAGADVFGGGEVPGFALGAEVGAEERGVRAVAFDAVAGLAGVGLAAVAGFPAGAGEAKGCVDYGNFQAGDGFVGIEGMRIKAEFAEELVDASVGFGFHRGWKVPSDQ